MFRVMVLALAVLLAGCTDPAAQAAEAAEAGGTSIHFMQDVTFFAGNISTLASVTGTFLAQDDGAIQGPLGPTGQAGTGFRQHDVTEHIPAGIPVFVELRVISGAVVTGLVASDFTAIWTSGCENCPTRNSGTAWSGAVLRTDQTMNVNVLNSANTPPREEPYEIELTVTSAPDRIPSGMVIAVEMPALGSHILFEGDVPDVIVFGPDDRFVTILPSSDPQMYIDEGMETGEYAFLPVGHASFYKLRSGLNIVDGEAINVQARILTQEIRTTGPHPVTQNTEFTFNLDRQPLQMAVLYFGGSSQDATVSMTSPDGARVEAGHAGLSAGAVFGFDQTAMGDNRLTSGTYTLAWVDTVNDGSMNVQEFFTLYQR